MNGPIRKPAKKLTGQVGLYENYHEKSHSHIAHCAFFVPPLARFVPACLIMLALAGGRPAAPELVEGWRDGGIGGTHCLLFIVH